MDTLTFIHKRYTRIEKIGEGGMATVYRAFDTQLERDVAIKVILPEYAGRPNFRSRFEREVKALAKLQHPNIVPVYDYHSSAKDSYYVMALLEGETLREIIKAGKTEPRMIRSVMAGMLSALQYAHEKEIIHRDVKPDNIWIDRQGQVYLTDFGIVHMEDQDITQLTRAGMFLGTPQYASPEQIEGRGLTPASDIYSLGAMLYELLTGRVPFTGSMNAVISGHLTREVPPVDPSAVDASLRRYVPVAMKMLMKDPSERYASCREITDALMDDGPAPPVRPVSSSDTGRDADDTTAEKDLRRPETAGDTLETRAADGRGAVPAALPQNGPAPGSEELNVRMRELPGLKNRVKNTQKHLDKLEKTKDGVSEQLYLELKNRYAGEILSARAEIERTEIMIAARTSDLSIDMASLKENIAQCERELGELDHLASKAAIPAGEYREKKALLKKSMKDMKARLGRTAREYENIARGGGSTRKVLVDEKPSPRGEEPPSQNVVPAVRRGGPRGKILAGALGAAALVLAVYGAVHLFQWYTRTPGRVLVDGTTMYSSHSYDARIVGTLRAGETVDIYTAHVSRNDKEVITLRPTSLRSGARTHYVPWKTMLGVLGDSRDLYFVAYPYAPGTVHQGYIPKSDVETMKGKTWYRIRAKNGTTGWVLSGNVRKGSRPARQIKKEEAAPERTEAENVQIAKLQVQQAAASSELSNEEGQYGAFLSIDGNVNTVWIEGEKETPESVSWLRFEFKDTVRIVSLKIINGFPLQHPSFGDMYARYNRVTAARLKFEDGEESITLSDGVKDFQAITLKKPHTTKYVELTITAVTRGTENDSACIAEIEFNGQGPRK